VAGTVWRKRPQILRRLRVTEGSLLDRGANPGALIALYKRHGDEGKPMTAAEIQARLDDPAAEITKADANYDLQRHLELTDPGLSYGEALAKRWKDDDVRALYLAHQEAGADPAPAVRKAAPSEPGAAAWRGITMLADQLRVEAGYQITKEEAVDETCRQRPDLYRQYVREGRGLE